MSAEQLLVRDVLEADYHYVYADEPISKVAKVFSEKRAYMVLVLDQEDRFIGAITERLLLRPHVNPTKALAKSAAIKVPYISPNDSVIESAKLMYENNLKALPVLEGKRPVGIVTVRQIGTSLRDLLKKVRVREAMTKDPLTIREDETIGKAASIMRGEGVSRLPVTSKRGSLSGIVTLHDIIEKVIRPREKASWGEVTGEKVSVFGNSVKSIMSRPVITARPNESLYVALDRMIKHDISCLVVVEDGKVEGILSVIDVLEPIVEMSSEATAGITVQISHKLMDLSEAEKNAILDVAGRFASRLSKALGEGTLSLHFKAHREKHGPQHLIHCRARLFTNKCQVTGSGEGWRADLAVRYALDKIEREIITRKELAVKYPFANEVLRHIAESY
ncbi:MAG: CBS domain-containing protein [Aigarchaeota archaeon]|nr:CBS domain-containing protein [Aigarchaeota archaeon]MDW8093092.1 CBS domain-containing protein [Nitrososphaerota archaeon]